MLLLPDELMAEDCRQGWVPHVGQALDRGKFADEAALLLTVTIDEHRHLRRDHGLAGATPCGHPGRTGKSAAAKPARPSPSRLSHHSRPLNLLRQAAGHIDAGFAELFSQPAEDPGSGHCDVGFQTAATGTNYRVGPGSIIHFNKSCEEMLDLEVGGQAIAQGEPIKVGDKFGIRLTSLVMPGERFTPLSKPAQ